jgi:hypothetical protein
MASSTFCDTHKTELALVHRIFTPLRVLFTLDDTEMTENEDGLASITFGFAKGKLDALIATCRANGCHPTQPFRLHEVQFVLEWDRDATALGMLTTTHNTPPNIDTTATNDIESRVLLIATSTISTCVERVGMHACRSCAEYNPDTIVSCCGRCKHRLYCSKACQHADWKRHRRVCATKMAENTTKRDECKHFARAARHTCYSVSHGPA